MTNTAAGEPVAFPYLTAEEMACIAQIGTLRTVQPGEELFAIGERNFSCFVIKSGAVSIVDCSSGQAVEVVEHDINEFTGDIDLLTGRPSCVAGIVSRAGEVYEIAGPAIRRLLNEVPELSDKLLEAFQLRRRLLEASSYQGVRVIGASHSRDTLQIREFFHKNNVYHTFLDTEELAGQKALQQLGLQNSQIPITICNKHTVIQPSLPELAECLGICREIAPELFDLVVVGAGPSGLAAAVYAGSEGLKTLVVDRIGPGGQAGQSSKIENYMGFPSGLSGAELANRGYLQALKFGVEFTAPVSVQKLTRAGEELHLQICTGQVVRTRTVLVTTGASYRRLPLENSTRWEGEGVYYSATSVESRACRQQTAVIVGGGNSAGQAAMFLSRTAGQVKIVIRGDDLGKSMSAYLCRRIAQTPNIEVLKYCEVAGLFGDDCLQSISVVNRQTNELCEMECASLFVFIGAKPHTEWLPEAVALDEYGFILTGPTINQHPRWQESRPPCELETTLPGVFASGDVRSGTTKRCAFAVGDGALAVSCVHQFLAR